MRHSQKKTSWAIGRPFAEKLVVIVGGDPIAAKAAAAFRAIGAMVECCPGFDAERRCRQAVGAADLVVAMTAYMSHSHRDIVKRRLARTGLKVIWVNHLGMQALKRAVGDAF